MLRRIGWSFMVLVGLALLIAVQAQAGDIQALAQALDANHNGYIDDAEILQAIQYWVTGEPVPGTAGQVISDEEILKLIDIWINHTPIAPAPAPSPSRVCPESFSGRVLTVPGQYSTIQAAVDNAREGDTILVKPGSYPGGITITKSLILEGEQGSSLTKIQGGPNSKGITVLRARDVVIRGFAITGGQAGVDIENSSSVCLEGNDISHNLGPGISATTVSQAVAAYPRGITIANNRIVGNVGFGISANGILRLEILGNEISETAVKPDGTAGQAVALQGGSKIKVKGNKIARSREFGIFASGVIELTVQDNEISEVPDVPGSETGVAIALWDGTTASTISGNEISESDIGIDVEKGTAITISGNHIQNSKINGMLISSSIQVSLSDNQIVDTLPRSLAQADSAIALQIEDESTVTAKGNEIKTAFGYGLLIASGSEVTLEGNGVSQVQGKPGTPGRGIGVAGASAEITKNNVTDNADDGIAILAGGSAEISDNWIANNGGFGIFAAPDAQVSCPDGNQFADNGADIADGVPQACLGSAGTPPLLGD